MHSRSLLAAALLLTAAVGLYALAAPAQPPGKEEPPKAASKPLERVLPGLRRDGFVQLPNQWSLKPAGRHLEVGDFPVNIALHTDHCPKDKLDGFVRPLLAASTERVKNGGLPYFQSHMWDGSAVPLEENLQIAEELLEQGVR